MFCPGCGAPLPASYDDLLSYYNQRDHRIIDRFLIQDALDKLRICTLEIQTSRQYASYDEQYRMLCEAADPNSSTERKFLDYLYKNDLRLPDGNVYTFLVGQEKGIDVRIALDIIRLAHRKEYDVALVFSQDQDLSEVADEIRVIANEQKRWIRIASAFPASPTYENSRGINKTDWIRIDRQTYDSCIDPRDYRGS